MASQTSGKVQVMHLPYLCIYSNSSGQRQASVKLFKMNPGGNPIQVFIVSLRYEMGGQRVQSVKLAFQKAGSSQEIHLFAALR